MQPKGNETIIGITEGLVLTLPQLVSAHHRKFSTRAHRVRASIT